MFNNLVESDLHLKESARRSWFFVATLGAYTVLFMVAGVASIYAYDAHLEEQTNEYVVTFVPPVLPATEATPARDSAPRASADNSRRMPERAQAIARINESTKPPAEISSAPLKVKELPAFGPVAITGRDFDPGTTGTRGTGTGNNNPVADPPRTVKVDIGEAPPERVAPPPPPKVLKISTVLNGRATSLPKPLYPKMAQSIRVSGVVTVQVLIDETGKVVSAHAVSGHPLLQAEAVKAARQARFTPTILGDQPVKVSGVITYNFTL